jgi:membrane fusion protein, heavy metal efflux system
MKKYSILLPILVVVLACKSKPENSEKPAESPENATSLSKAQMANANIELGQISQRSITSTMKVNGKIDVPPQNLVSVSVPMGGYLASTELLEGMFIKKGQIIAKIEGQQYIQLQQEYLSIKSQCEFTEKEYVRQKDLNQSKISSDKVFEQAKSAYLLQQISIKALEEKLKMIGINPATLTLDKISKSINIYSPISGFVSKVNVNIGKYVDPVDVLFQLVNTSDIHLALTIFEKDINQIAIGQRLTAFTNSNPDKKYPCEIILIGKDFSENKSVEVHCHFLNYDKNLLPGMYMNAEIALKSHLVSTLPSEAIVNFENKNYIFIAKANNGFEMQEINIGQTENDFVEIMPKTDLSNQKIVVKGAYTLLMKMKNTEEE